MHKCQQYLNNLEEIIYDITILSGKDYLQYIIHEDNPPKLSTTHEGALLTHYSRSEMFAVNLSWMSDPLCPTEEELFLLGEESIKLSEYLKIIKDRGAIVCIHKGMGGGQNVNYP